MFALLMPVVEGWLGPNLAKYAKSLIWIVLAVLILLALWGGKCAYDRNLISSHDAKQDAQVSNAVISADRYAGEQKDVRDQSFSNSQLAIDNAVSNAVTANPTAVKHPVGPASQSYYDELRRQQRDARR